MLRAAPRAIGYKRALRGSFNALLPHYPTAHFSPLLRPFPPAVLKAGFSSSFPTRTWLNDYINLRSETSTDPAVTEVGMKLIERGIKRPEDFYKIEPARLRNILSFLTHDHKHYPEVANRLFTYSSDELELITDALKYNCFDLFEKSILEKTDPSNLMPLMQEMMEALKAIRLDELALNKNTFDKSEHDKLDLKRPLYAKLTLVIKHINNLNLSEAFLKSKNKYVLLKLSSILIAQDLFHLMPFIIQNEKSAPLLLEKIEEHMAGKISASLTAYAANVATTHYLNRKYGWRDHPGYPVAVKLDNKYLNALIKSMPNHLDFLDFMNLCRADDFDKGIHSFNEIQRNGSFEKVRKVLLLLSIHSYDQYLRNLAFSHPNTLIKVCNFIESNLISDESVQKTLYSYMSSDMQKNQKFLDACTTFINSSKRSLTVEDVRFIDSMLSKENENQKFLTKFALFRNWRNILNIANSEDEVQLGKKFR